MARAPKPPAPISNEAKTRLDDILRKFVASNELEYKFPMIPHNERAYVHLQCLKMGLKPKTSGYNSNRRIKVLRWVQGEDEDAEKFNATDTIPQLVFSEASAEIMGNLFMRYPPGDGEGEVVEQKIVEGCQKFEKAIRRKDPMFCRNYLKKEEIAKKVEDHAAKMEKKSKIMEGRLKLPMASYQDVLTSAVESNQVILIAGETGCGKTTQVPQYLMDHMWSKGTPCKIMCTQPRRISAISVAERISFERGQNVGEDIGYKIRLESKGGKHSSVVFCTNGILLRILISKGGGKSKKQASKKRRTKQQDLSDLTHIIVDEIHERDRHSDLMLAILRDMLPSQPHLRLILMSATVDSERFSQYFGGCLVIRVPGFTYPVNTFYLEDVLSILRSVEENHLEKHALDASASDLDLSEEEKLALDEAISLAWSDDNFDPLLELVSTKKISKVFDYQHSVTGLTPLMVFAGNGRVDQVYMLLSNGADCKLRAKDGTTALEVAERLNQLESARMLKGYTTCGPPNSKEQQDLLDKYLTYFNPENIDMILIEQLLTKICNDSKDGAILVFLPGWDDKQNTGQITDEPIYFLNPTVIAFLGPLGVV